MDDSFGVGRVEGIRQLGRNIQQAVERHRPRTQFAIEGDALEQFHGNKRLHFCACECTFFYGKDGADVGMVQGRSRARLEQEAVERTLLARELRRQEFQRHPAAERQILRFVDHTHPAAAQLAGNAVVKDGLVDHQKSWGWAIILGGKTRAVNEAVEFSRLRELWGSSPPPLRFKIPLGKGAKVMIAEFAENSR